MAGGAARRFGSDKALALHAGQPLIAGVADALSPQCSEIVICGRRWGGFTSLDDLPARGLGPMAGLAAALAYAEAAGHTAVLCAPCDIIGLPPDSAARLSPGPAVVENQWLIGLWPVSLAPLLARALASEGAMSARRWADVAAARRVELPSIRNINRPADLTASG